MDKIDPVAKYLLIQCGVAIAFPVVWMSAVLAPDIGGIARLITMCEQPLATAAVLFAGSIAILAPMIFATGVMLLADR